MEGQKAELTLTSSNDVFLFSNMFDIEHICHDV